MAATTTKRTTRKPAAPVTVTLRSVVDVIAERKGIDATKQGKAVRGYIRAHFDDVAAQWPALRDAQKQNRDGNRYPPMPKELADSLIERFTAGNAK